MKGRFVRMIFFMSHLCLSMHALASDCSTLEKKLSESRWDACEERIRALERICQVFRRDVERQDTQFIAVRGQIDRLFAYNSENSRLRGIEDHLDAELTLFFQSVRKNRNRAVLDEERQKVSNFTVTDTSVEDTSGEYIGDELGREIIALHEEVVQMRILYQKQLSVVQELQRRVDASGSSLRQNQQVVVCIQEDMAQQNQKNSICREILKICIAGKWE